MVIELFLCMSLQTITVLPHYTKRNCFSRHQSLLVKRISKTASDVIKIHGFAKAANSHMRVSENRCKKYLKIREKFSTSAVLGNPFKWLLAARNPFMTAIVPFAKIGRN
jgi:hypothetical protein